MLAESYFHILTLPLVGDKIWAKFTYNMCNVYMIYVIYQYYIIVAVSTDLSLKLFGIHGISLYITI